MTAPKSSTPPDLPPQSPVFHAINAPRYERQGFINTYERQFVCRFIVVIDALFPPSVTMFEELIYDADPSTDLHILLASPGGDGETAVRLVRSAQARCRQLTVIVPDQAKSAATLLALGAHHIVMGPMSDLGPIDPQFPLGDGSLVSAKNIIDAVEEASKRVQAAPETYPIHATLLGDVTALMVQQARSALARTEDQLEEALRSNSDRKPAEIQALKKSLKALLIKRPASHAALFGAQDAKRAGLPVEEVDPKSNQWQLIWRLWAKYFALGPAARVYEGARASHIGSWASPFINALTDQSSPEP